jgi:aminoglycoside phosphotransferase (APT) family kinase protein
MSYPEMRAGRAVDIAHEVANRYSAENARVHDGFVNYVVMADDKYVIKAPQDDEQWLQDLWSERTVLTLLEDADLSPTVIPRLVEFSADPAYLVATYVPGRASVPAEELQKRSAKEREALGHDLGSYLVRQATALSSSLTEENGLSPCLERWDKLFTNHVGNFYDNRYPTLTNKANMLYERWSDYCAGLGSTALHFIHGNFSVYNFGISQTGRLVSVFDFANAGAGSMEHEVSELVTIDEELFKACLSELDQAGMAPGLEHARLWRELKDLEMASYWILHNNTRHPAFLMGRDTITHRYPQLDWSELY